MSTKAKQCDECKHFSVGLDGIDPFCKKWHKPRFYLPKSLIDLNFGWKRRCDDFEEKAGMATKEDICSQGETKGRNKVAKTNKVVSVPFDVVEIWYNDICTPFTLVPQSEFSRKEYAIKIGDEFFHLGESGNGLHICDYMSDSDNSKDYRGG